MGPRKYADGIGIINLIKAGRRDPGYCTLGRAKGITACLTRADGSGYLPNSSFNEPLPTIKAI
jgi:hypothetical protein